MKNRFINIFLNYACSLILVFSLTSCKKKVSEETISKEAEQIALGTELSLTSEQIKAIGLETGTITLRNLKSALKVNGRLELPPQNKAQVSVLIGGIVKDIPIVEGQYVHKGQILAILENVEYLQTQQEYLENKYALEFLKTEFERQSELQKENINSTKTFQQAKSNYFTSAAKHKILSEKIKLFGVNPENLQAENIKSSFSITAPISGYIKKINLYIGKYAESNISHFEIVDNRFLHIDLTIYEQDVSKVHVGQQLTFSIINDPHSLHTATIFSINKAFEDNTQAVIAHAKMNKVDDMLLPGMYIEARIQMDDSKLMTLPDEAIVSNGDDHYIYVQKQDKLFRQVQVKTGTTDMGFTEIIPIEPLSDKDQIVISGAYYLLSQLTKGEGEHHE